MTTFFRRNRRHKAIERRRQHGFSFVEMAVVIAVMAVVAGVVVPSFMTTYQFKLVARAVSDVGQIQDAARWFFINSNATTARCCRWPGQNVTSTAVTDWGCTASTACNANPLYELTAGTGCSAVTPYLNAAITTDPWGNTTTASLGSASVPGNSGDTPDQTDKFTVTIHVPDAYVKMAQAQLANTTTGTSVGGFTPVSSTIQRPGTEATINAAISDLKTNWLPNNTYTTMTCTVAVSSYATCGSTTACNAASCAGSGGTVVGTKRMTIPSGTASICAGGLMIGGTANMPTDQPSPPQSFGIAIYCCACTTGSAYILQSCGTTCP